MFVVVLSLFLLCGAPVFGCTCAKANNLIFYLFFSDSHSSMLDPEDEETNEHMVIGWLRFTIELFPLRKMVWIFTVVLTFFVFLIE